MRRAFRNSSTLLLISVWAAGCSSPAGFRLRFSDRPETQNFPCEVQGIHENSRVAVQTVAHPGRTSLTTQPGDMIVLWLYHLQGEVDTFRDDPYAYTIALEVRDLAERRWELPAKEIGVTFFCDNWGHGFRAAELHGTKGWVRITRASDREISGELDVTCVGYKERPDKSREELTLSLAGPFKARR